MKRPPHLPQRTCVACRQAGAKAGLVRVVRTPHGEVRVDLSGKLGGRGAYLCRRAACIEQALRQKKLGRALGVAIGDEVAAELRRLAPEAAPSECNGEATRVGHEGS
jgi:predicted RNA-binding protein YlxR (DUF448 family)